MAKVIVAIGIVAIIAAAAYGFVRHNYPGGQAGNETLTTKGQYPFCRSKSALDSLTGYVDRGDQEKVSSMFKAKTCMLLKKGLAVHLEESSPRGWLKVRLADNGMILYTVKGALN